MTNPTQTSQKLPFTPLNSDPQNTTNPVLYYDPNASIEDIYECAVFRLQAITSLLKNLDTYKDNPETINEALTLLEELNPIALKLRLENHP